MRTGSRVWELAPTALVDAADLSRRPSAWTLPLLLAALGLVAPAVRAPRLWARGAGPILAIAGGAALPLLYAAPLWLAVVVPGVVGGAFAVTAAVWSHTGIVPSGGVLALSATGWALLILVAGAPALGSTGLTAWLAFGVSVLAAISARLTQQPSAGQPLLTMLSVTAGGVAVFAWTTMLEVAPAPRAFVLAVVGAAVLLAVQAPVVRSLGGIRLGAEAGSGVVAAAGVVLIAAEESLGWLALGLTVVGAAVVVLALVVADRRQFTGLGGLLLAAASWVRLSDVGVEVVEAYTLPTALVLVVAGVWRLSRDPSADTLRSVLPGLVLALAPSLFVALDDPVSLRGFLLGSAALVLVLVGAALRWSAPLLSGALTLGVLAARQLGPLAVAVPRWSLLGAAGLLLFAVGITWEQRRRDLTVAARYVASLR